jgi:hypothetical protein
MPQDTPKMETLLDTELQDLRITDKHAAIPAWLCQPAPPALFALACLDFSPQQSRRVVVLDAQD